MTAHSAPKAAEPSDDSGAASTGLRYLRTFLNRHVPTVRHATAIGDVLGVSYTAAYRRLNGTVEWELGEVEKIAAHFGETLTSVFASDNASDFVAAMLVAGPVRVPCQLIPGRAVREPARNSIVALKVGEQWMVMPATEAGLSPCFEVKQMRVSGDSDRRWRVAVLDDDPTETASLKQHFTDRGCEVQAFTSMADLVPQMKLRPFDAYVVDWILPEGSAAELVGMIRADDPGCPIAVLTGKMRSDVMIEPAVAEVISTYQVLFFEKPTRLPIISAQLLQALAGR